MLPLGFLFLLLLSLALRGLLKGTYYDVFVLSLAWGFLSNLIGNYVVEAWR